MSNLQSLVEMKLEPVGISGTNIIYVCPKCDDKSGHLYVDYNKNVYNCFKCAFRGRDVKSLIKSLGIDIDFNYERLYNEKDVELTNILSMNEKKKPIALLEYSTDLKVLSSYYFHHSKELSNDGINYLLTRGLTSEIIHKLSIREGVNRYNENLVCNNKVILGRDYSGRIMIPSLRKDGTISFFVARDYIGNKSQKYLNPPSEVAISSEDVWNLDIVESDSVIICEGVMTAIAASPYKLNAVATYGKSIASKSSNMNLRVMSQGEKLLSRKFKNYYLAYDADARIEAIKSCKYLYDRGAENVYLVIINPDIYGAKADVADIGYEEFVKLLRNAIRYEGGINRLMLEF